MHILLLGATGAIGLHVADELLAASHTLVIYARSPQKLPESILSNSHAQIIKGELSDHITFESALDRVDTVISTLGPEGRKHPKGTPLAKFYAYLLDRMKARGIKRIIALSTPSYQHPLDKSSLFLRFVIFIIWAFFGGSYDDVIAIANTISEAGKYDQDLEWTVIRVPMLTNEKRRSYVAGYAGDGKTSNQLARLAYAVFIVDELEKKEWLGKLPVLSSP